jgi:hypothetical protein
MSNEQMEMWDKPNEEISTSDLDQAVTFLRLAKDEYTSAKRISDEHHAAMKEREVTLMKLMERAGKEKYICEGVGLVTISKGLSVKTPKTPEQKEAFFNWLREHEGEDAYHAYMTVNSNSLNSFYNLKNREYGERGEILEIAGLDQPTEYSKLSLRKA